MQTSKIAKPCHETILTGPFPNPSERAEPIQFVALDHSPLPPSSCSHLCGLTTSNAGCLDGGQLVEQAAVRHKFVVFVWRVR